MTRSRLARAAHVATTTVSLLLIVGVGTVIGALAAGYRPIVIQTGSMAPGAPAGSLIVAAPRTAESVERGDVVVMRQVGKSTVTHRVVEVERNGSQRFAITRGDANDAPDPAPYVLDGEQLVARWTVPELGGRLRLMFSPGPAMALMSLAVCVIAVQLLRAIWRRPESAPVVARPDEPDDADQSRSIQRSRRRRRALAVAPITFATTVGVSFALFTNTADVSANAFSTAECFDPQLRSVQSGQTTHALSGMSTIPVTPVDPTSSFVLASARSTANEPADSTVTVVLAGGGTDIEISRTTDDPSPDPVIVAWSLVEYDCGVSVQRGTTSGDGSDAIDVAIATVDPSSSFALVTTSAPATATDFDGDDVFAAGVTAANTLSISGGPGVNFDAGRTFAWQVVSFDDPADIDVQTVTGTLAIGESSAILTIPTPADPSTTFLLTGATTTSSGVDIGERLIRTHLVDSTSIEVSRGVAGDAISVSVQVVTLLDGSTVQHGTVDLLSGFPATTVAIEPVDATRSTPISTVAIPGLTAGGSTTHLADDVPGEASATFVLSDAETVAVERSVTSSDASFGWQVIEWAGPTWWDADYDFRQRIDVDTTAAGAPDAYSVPVTFDHASLVAIDLATSDGRDVRVVRWDGVAWTELDRVLGDDATWNATDTTFWFRTVDPIPAASTGTYWLYYGNPDATSPPADPEEVYLLEEDFDSGTLGDFEDRTAGTGWYAADPWTKRIPITIAGGTVGSDLTDFPVFVSFTSPDLAANAQVDGSDIRFTAADGTTPLDHEIERWVPGTGELGAWVRVPTVASASATTFYVHYGAANAPDQQAVRSTWPGDVEAAWHLARDPAGSAPHVDDSTTGRHDGLSLGSMTSGDLVSGLVADAVDFDGTNDGFQVDSFEVAGTELTVSAWVRVDAYTTDARIVSKSVDDATPVFDLAVTATGAVRGRVTTGGVIRTATTGAGVVGSSSWQHVAMTWDGSTVRVLVDAVEEATAPATGPLVLGPDTPVTIGNLLDGSRPLDGRLDEVRVESVARSDDWIAAAEANQRTPAAFASAGAAQTGSWFGQGAWSARKPITVDASLVDATVTDFALLIDIVDPQLQSQALADGSDIVFTAADGVTRLDHVVEQYDSGSGALTAWVRVPTLSASENTELFLYYANATADEQSDTTGVFGPDADTLLFGSQ